MSPELAERIDFDDLDARGWDAVLVMSGHPFDVWDDLAGPSP